VLAFPDPGRCRSIAFAVTDVQASALHPALRERAGKTVMSLENFVGGSSGEESYTPDQRRALDDLFSLTYEELRRLASSVRRGDPSATLTPTVLVNEAWIKMSTSPGMGSTSRLHFKRIAARAMRQLLIEAARRRGASKRGGEEDVTIITYDESMLPATTTGRELLALDTALEELARLEPRQATMIESRFFGGLDIAETAALLNVSEATILRDWRAAKAWLTQALSNAS
jgi:RNA polymerase sigma factor (TIGR02999 family)